MHWRILALQPAIERPHRWAHLQPHCLDRCQHRRSLRPQVERAVKLEICPYVSDSIRLRHSHRNGVIYRL